MTRARAAASPEELERMAHEADVELATFLADIDGPLNRLRKIAGKQPRKLRDELV